MTELQRDIVLVVDDSPETLGFVTQALEAAGVTVLVATSGSAALNIAERITPDVVLMDAVMPGLSGFETCRQLKSQPHLQHVPVIFMTGLSETEDIVAALESGGVDFLTKPINLEELQARIRVHLANARSVQNARIALDAAGRHLIAVSLNGAVCWSTPQCAQLLDAVPQGIDAVHLVGSQLGEWLQNEAALSGADPFSVTLPGNLVLQLAYLGGVGKDEYLFRMTAENHPNQDRILGQHFGLTAREAEVLVWIARGKSNRDIGEILGLSPRTVNKHLEQIYVKLGVENRASAAVRAAHVLHDF